MKQKRDALLPEQRYHARAAPNVVSNADDLVHDPTIKKLGDFSSVRESLQTFKPFHNLLISDSPSEGVVQLGNFSRIVNQLRKSSESPANDSKNEEHATDDSLETKSIINSQNHLPEPTKDAISLHDSERESQSQSGSHEAATITPATTPPSPAQVQRIKHRSVTECDSRAQASQNLLSVLRHESQRVHDTSHVGPLISYRPSKMSPTQVIWAALRSETEVHEALEVKLVVQRTFDRLTSISYPTTVSNGIHVFLDMSNIEISFQNSLRLKFDLPDTVRFAPLPQLNLDFLSEILTRNRSARSLVVGCSMKPGQQEPKYIQPFRDLGYHVDLRTRRKLEDAGQGTNERLASANPGFRYVEDLVDETLQTRIGEAVMEYYQDQGTIVLATGDAKPAKYSDGFFVYVDRALRMGWNVEVVSWRCSLSVAWRELKATGNWGDKFRIIELDDYLDELLACYK